MAELPLQVPCPLCRKVTPWEGNPSRPFCSERCRLLDFGAWDEERYRVAAREEAPASEDDEPS